jgi:hypothetical protein
MQNAKNKTQHEEEETAQEDFEVTTAPARRQVDDIIDDYKAEALQRDTTPKATIYKYDHEKGGTGNDRTFAGYFTGDDIPNRHAIGLLYGSGRYCIQLDQPRGTAKQREQTSIVFRIHPIYDQHKAAADAEKERKRIEAQRADSINFNAGATQNQLTAQPFTMMKEIFSMLLPVIKAAQPVPAIGPAVPRTETPAEMLNSYAMMQKLLKTQLFDTAATFKEFSRRYAGPENIQDAETDDQDENDQREPSIVEKIITMIEPFFNLIAQKSESAKLAAMGLKAAPQFIEILNDPALCRLIVNHFDRTRGREKSDLALKNIGIDRVQLFKRPPAAAGSPPAQTKAPPPTKTPGPAKA